MKHAKRGIDAGEDENADTETDRLLIHGCFLHRGRSGAGFRSGLQPIRSLAANELLDAWVGGGLELGQRTVEQNLRLVRTQTGQRIEHDHAVGHAANRLEIMRDDNAGDRPALRVCRINSLITSLIIGSRPVVGSS